MEWSVCLPHMIYVIECTIGIMPPANSRKANQEITPTATYSNWLKFSPKIAWTDWSVIMHNIEQNRYPDENVRTEKQLMSC